MTKEQLEEMQEKLLSELDVLKEKLVFLRKRELRNKAIFITLGSAVLVWAIFFSGTGV